VYGTIYIYEFKGDVTGRIPWVPYRSELAIRHEDWESGIPLQPIKIGSIGIHQPWNAPNEPGINIAGRGQGHRRTAEEKARAR
jgi:hypothetical protein